MQSITSHPTVSVYIPSKNRSQLLKQAIESVCTQTYEHIEIIVVDDASTDDTMEMLHRINSHGRPIIVHSSEVSIGAAAARNIAIGLATGELITGIDDDDIWLNNRIEQMIKLIKPGVGFVCASDIFEPGSGHRYLWRRPPHIDVDQLLRRNVVGNQVLARRKDILACGGFDETLPASQDYDLWIRLAMIAGRGVGIAHPLQIINIMPGRDRITTSPKRLRGILRVYRKHCHLMTRDQRKSHIFNAIRTLNRPLTVRKAVILWSRNDAFRIIAHLARNRIQYIDAIVEYFAYLRDRKIIAQALENH